ncbi:tetratricopeptide repeat protein [Flagellimonas allohymeniacidonis]|nr:tetratricopeptide repeat protein [Allomuricauda hymeniacidonis]
MKTSTLLFITLLFFCLPFIRAQDNQGLDSLLNAYKSLSDGLEKVKTAEAIFIETRRSSPELALEYLHKGLKLSEKISSKEDEAMALKNLGMYYKNYYLPDSVAYYFERAETASKKLESKQLLFGTLYEWTRFENLEGNFKKALDLSEKSVTVAKEMKNGEMLSDAFQRKSTIYLDKGEFKLAIEQLLNAVRVLDTLNQENPLKRAIVDVGIGRTEVLRNNSEEGLPYLFKGLEAFKELDHTNWLAITYMEIGSAYYHLKDYEKALENYQSSLDQSHKMKRDDFVAANYGNIGAVLMEQGRYDEALEYQFKSNDLSVKRGSINNQIISFNDIGSTYFLKADYPKSVTYFTKAIQLADSIGSIDNLADAFKERAEVYETMGNSYAALQDFKAYQNLNDSIFNETKSRQIEELKTQYETEKKEQQIVLQDREITVLEQKAEISNLQKILLAGLLVISFIGFYGIRQKMKRNRLEKEKVDAELAFKKKELTTHALHLAKKNEVLEGLKQKAKELKETEESKNGYQQLIRTIDFDLQDDNNWENFSRYFEEVHKDFNSNVKSKYPQVTSNELRLLALLKMNLSSKEIANILNISPEGIKKARYRLRKKLDITTEDSLQDLVLSL